MSIAGAVMAMVSLALHYTKQGNDKWGCTHERLMMSGKMNSNVYCTREMGACHYQPNFIRGSDKNNASIACSEAVSLQHNVVTTFANVVAGDSQMDANHSDGPRSHSINHVLSPGLHPENDAGDTTPEQRAST